MTDCYRYHFSVAAAKGRFGSFEEKGDEALKAILRDFKMVSIIPKFHESWKN
jgi:hypothetical protein